MFQFINRAPTNFLKNSLTQIPLCLFHQAKSSQKPLGHWNIIKGDKVAVTTGKDKGKSGTVLRVYRQQNKVLIQGINLKMQRIESQKDEQQQGGVRQISQPVHVSNVALIDPSTGKATKIKISLAYTEDGKKLRVSKSSGSIIEKPIDPAMERKVRHKNKVDGVKDTPPSIVTEVTYRGEDFASMRSQFLQEMKIKEGREKLLVFKE